MSCMAIRVFVQERRRIVAEIFTAAAADGPGRRLRCTHLVVLGLKFINRLFTIGIGQFGVLNFIRQLIVNVFVIAWIVKNQMLIRLLLADLNGHTPLIDIVVHNESRLSLIEAARPHCSVARPRRRTCRIQRVIRVRRRQICDRIPRQ